MLIDKFITTEKNTTKGGSNKKCFLFDEYALLYGSFKEEELQKVIKISNVLEQKGVAILSTLEYKVDVPPNELGYARGYSLQRRASGDELYRRGMTEEEYTARLKEIVKMDPEKLDKFISDWLAITEAGLRVDPSKCENFFYSEGKISFIDLGLRRKPVPLQISFDESTHVLMGLGLRNGDKDADDLMQICKNVARIFLKKGLAINDIHETMSKYHILNTEEKINRVIEDLKQENFQNHPKTQKTKLLRTLNKQDVTNSEILEKKFQKTAGIFFF